MSDSNDHVGFSFQLSETPPPARIDGRTPLGELELDLGAFGETQDPGVNDDALDLPEPESEPATTDEPNLVEQAAPPEPSQSSEASHVALEPLPPVGEPRIKKIEFPVRAARKSRPDRVQPEVAAPAPSPSRPITRFSPSISAENPRRSLESDAFGDAQPADPPATQASDLAPPEDFPDPPVSSSQDEPADWGTDTPTAREIWRKARVTWQTTSRQAVLLGGQGIRAGQKLAVQMNDRVREGLKKAAEQRQQTASVEQNGSRAQDAEQTRAQEQETKDSPSMAGRIILGLAKTAARKVAAPASAVAAASLVYFAGTHFLGTEGTVALSKAVSGPEVPELGSLDNGPPRGAKKKNAAAPTGGADSPNPKAPKEEAGPSPMQTEVTDMPAGLSWPGKGLIEVVTSEEELIYVDGVFTGRGPLRRIPVTPGKHEISIRTENSERTGTVEVTANRNTRAVFR